VVAPVAAAAASGSSSSSSSSSSTYGGAIQIGVGVDAVLLEDESQVDGMDGEEAARMLDALRALEARVAGLKQKVAEKAASAVAAGGDGGK
jgi:cell division septum initiation protein DivIVA